MTHNRFLVDPCYCEQCFTKEEQHQMSNTKHTPLIRLQAAQSSYKLANENCPHWDYEGNSENIQDCCLEVLHARRELQLARKAASK